MEPDIMIGCPVRNRAWILPQYLESIYGLDYPRKSIILCFIVNDCTDNTAEILCRFRDQHESEYQKIIILRHDLDQIEDIRGDNTRQMIYESLSELRNLLLHAAKNKGADYLFSVDSDIIMPSDALRRLLKADKDIIAGQIWNDEDHYFPNIMVKTNSGINHYCNFPRQRLFRCDVTGAIYLIARKVIEAGVQYEHHWQGEDIPFCLSAAKKGFELWVDPSVQCNHVMTR